MIASHPESGTNTVTPFWSHFVPLPENSSALQAVQWLSQELTGRGARHFPAPLLLHGLPGTGKTVLAETLIRVVIAGSSRTARILPARELTDETADLVGCDLLVLEDLQHLPAKAAETICQLLDRRNRYRRPTVLTSAAGPAGLNHLSHRLTSRLAAGLVIGLEPVSVSSRRVLLHGLAERRNLTLTPDAIDWIITQTPGGGARPLHGRIEQLARLAVGQVEALNAATVAALLDPDTTGEATTQPVSFDRIVNRVSILFEVSPKDVTGPGRMRTLASARRLAMYLARDLTGASLPQIGRYFGNRDHTTVLHACRTVEAALPEDQRLRRTVRELKAELA